MRNIIQSLNPGGRIIFITFCLFVFIIGCQKEISEEEVWQRIREIEALGKTKSEKDIDRLIKIFVTGQAIL